MRRRDIPRYTFACQWLFGISWNTRTQCRTSSGYRRAPGRSGLLAPAGLLMGVVCTQEPALLPGARTGVMSAVPHIFLRVVEAHLRRSSPYTTPRACFGAVSIVRRFGAALGRQLHYHCCILSSVFGEKPGPKESWDPDHEIASIVSGSTALSSLMTGLHRELSRGAGSLSVSCWPSPSGLQPELGDSSWDEAGSQ